MMDSAKVAQKLWAKTPLWKRAKALHRAAAILKENKAPIAESLVKEFAKPQKDAVNEGSDLIPCGRGYQDMLAGFPEGLLSTIMGKGPIIGDFLTMHPTVNYISFTNGDIGIAIARKASMVPMQMELGRKDACIVLKDDDLDLTTTNIIEDKCHKDSKHSV